MILKTATVGLVMWMILITKSLTQFHLVTAKLFKPKYLKSLRIMVTHLRGAMGSDNRMSKQMLRGDSMLEPHSFSAVTPLI